MWQLRGWRVPRRAGCSAACRQWQEQTPWDSPVAAWLCARADIATIVAHCNLYTTRNQNTAIGSNHSLQQGKHSHETCISSHRHRSPQTAFLVIQVFFFLWEIGTNANLLIFEFGNPKINIGFGISNYVQHSHSIPKMAASKKAFIVTWFFTFKQTLPNFIPSGFQILLQSAYHNQHM